MKVVIGLLILAFFVFELVSLITTIKNRKKVTKDNDSTSDTGDNSVQTDNHNSDKEV